MNMILQAHMKAIPTPASFSVPVQNGLLRRKCSLCEDDEQKKRLNLQRKATREATPGIPSIVHEVLRSPGQPLDHATRAYMDPRFGHDFNRVRIHADSKAAESARAVNALAYTVGQNVVFGEGQYTPGTRAGRQLLAHELVHVMQQSNSSIHSSSLVLGDFNGIHEREAESASARLSDIAAGDSATGGIPRLTPAQSNVVQRIGPVAGAAGGAAAGAAIAIVSFQAALDYGRSLATRFPGWLGVLPNCPCRESDVIADTATWGRDQNPLLGWFHPGAASSYRSNSTFSTVPGSAHGQQCTYDSSGNLITEGPGAGTPDSWSPNTNGAAHTWYDVASWQLLGWRIYNRYWQPNNGSSCSANRGENTLGRRVSEFLP